MPFVTDTLRRFCVFKVREDSWRPISTSGFAYPVRIRSVGRAFNLISRALYSSSSKSLSLCGIIDTILNLSSIVEVECQAATSKLGIKSSNRSRPIFVLSNACPSRLPPKPSRLLADDISPSKSAQGVSQSAELAPLPSGCWKPPRPLEPLHALTYSILPALIVTSIAYALFFRHETKMFPSSPTRRGPRRDHSTTGLRSSSSYRAHRAQGSLALFSIALGFEMPS